MQDLADWWIGDAHELATQTKLKREKYGSRDLVEIGAAYTNGTMMSAGVIDQYHFEVGAGFYILGKFHRIKNAHDRGFIGDADSWLDLQVYATMVRAVRAGAWEL